MAVITTLQQAIKSSPNSAVLADIGGGNQVYIRKFTVAQYDRVMAYIEKNGTSMAYLVAVGWVDENNALVVGGNNLKDRVKQAGKLDTAMAKDIFKAIAKENKMGANDEDESEEGDEFDENEEPVDPKSQKNS